LIKRKGGAEIATIIIEELICASQLILLCNLGKGMGVVLALAGIVAIALAANRLSLIRKARIYKQKVSL